MRYIIKIDFDGRSEHASLDIGTTQEGYETVLDGVSVGACVSWMRGHRRATLDAEDRT